jgi:bifunctional UDP-N-acetylglucosamine pyrophosphorylase/glucosamine-1-phosphate N-acetyltransferase
VVILAAGQGVRMRSRTIKLLHPVAGRPMVALALETVQALSPSRVIGVVGFQADRVRKALDGYGCTFVLQKEQRGTGHAVLQAARAIGSASRSTLLIVNGDVPLLRPATLRGLLAKHRRSGAALTVLTTLLEDPTGYGRVVRNAQSRLTRIVEHRDANVEQRRIREINSGIYCAHPAKLLSTLKRIKPNNAQGEYYLTDAVERLIRDGAKVHAVCHPDAEEVLGVNSRHELSRASAALYKRKADELQNRGVTLLDAARTWIDPRARIARDCTLYPDVIIEGPTVLGEGTVVYPGSRLQNCKVGREVVIKDHSVLIDSEIGDHAQVGPFAHLRPGSVLGTRSKVGNFVELKKTTLGRGSKAPHLTYLGDASIGADCNLGAGTITCNYDGSKKHTTTVARKVFIGSNSQLIAPVTIREGAYVAAGSTVTEDVPAGALAIARSRQKNVPGWVRRNKKD